jgi:hypothetical protein
VTDTGGRTLSVKTNTGRAMISTLATFIIINAAVVVLHRALGRPDIDMLAALKLSGWLTAVFVALNHGPTSIETLTSVMGGVFGTGPSG